MRTIRSFIRPGALLVALVAICGCKQGTGYVITPLTPSDTEPRREVLRGKLDGHWFQREIMSTGVQGPAAIELMYCPIVKDGPTVCRTALIWQNGVNQM